MPPHDLARHRTAAPGRRRRGGPLPAVLLAAALMTAGCSGSGSASDASSGRPAPDTSPPAASSPTASAPAPSPSAPSATGSSSPARGCRKPPAAAVPGAAGALDETDSGTFCLAVGERIDVFLTAPGGHRPGATRWAGITTSDARVLAPRSSGILTAPVGVTPGVFQALAAGTAELTSDVPAAGGRRSWHVTILVR